MNPTEGFLENLDKLARVLQTQDERPKEEENRDADAPFYMEFTYYGPLRGQSVRDGETIVARVEAHLEYFTLTLFRPLPDSANIAKIYDESYFVPADKLDLRNPFHRLYNDLADRFPRSTFANFKGVIVGPDAFPGTKPVFPPPDGSGSTRKAAAQTAIFLREQKDLLKEGVFEARGDDVVACYFQRAQIIYISALGAQGPKKKGRTPLPSHLQQGAAHRQ